MIKNQNPLALTIFKNIGKTAKITYKLGNGEQEVTSELLLLTDTHLSVMVNHPNPFLNTSIMLMEYDKKGTKIQVPKLVKTMLIPINNILSFRIL